MKLVLVNEEGTAVAEIDDVEGYDLSTTRGRAMLMDDILVALGHADRRVVLDMIRERRERAERAMAAAKGPGNAAGGPHRAVRRPDGEPVG